MAPAPPRGHGAATAATRDAGARGDAPVSGTRAVAHGGDDRSSHRRPAQKNKKKKMRTHRAYGLPNANQIFLTMVVVAMLFVELLRPNWLIFGDSDATAGLSGLRLASANDSTTRVSWSQFCDPNTYNYTLPLDTSGVPPLHQPFATRAQAVRACNSLTPEIVRVLTATSIAFSMLSVMLALYFHLGSPSQRQVVMLGLIPGVMLLATGVMGTAGLAIWQQHLGAYDNGDCFSVAVASTVISYAVAIAMGIRWRWPGIFAVDNEQLAFEVGRTWRRRRRRPPPTDDEEPHAATDSTDSPHVNNNTFYAAV